MNLSCVLLLIAIGFNYINEAESHFWRGHGWRGNGGWGLGGFSRPWLWNSMNWGGMGMFQQPWGCNQWGWNNNWNSWNGLQWGRPWMCKRSVEAEPLLECNYTQSTKVLSCTGLKKTVECDATTVFSKEISKSFTLFGISSEPLSGSQTKPEEIKYSLYPEKLDNSGWLDTRVMDPLLKKSFTYSLFHLPIYTDSGLRIEKPICWKKFVDLLKDVTLRVDTIPVLKEDGKTEKVKVLGRITVV